MKKSINTLRILSIDQINQAKSGHPGVVLGFAPVAYSLWHDFLKITPQDPDWFDRDRFILASGHASSMLYSLLHLTGFNVKLDDLKQFRRLNSLTPGHPEYHHTEGVDSTSGPLGQGIATACGMAIAENYLANKFNKEDISLVDHYTFVECGDGDLQEGVTLEALSLIGHLKLNKLIILWDSNRVQLDGPVSNAGGFKNSKAYFESLGFTYLSVKNPESELMVKKALEKAKQSSLPTIIEFHTTIGYGSPLSGSNKSHGAPLGEEKTEALKEFLGYKNKPFKVTKAVYKDYRDAIALNEPKYQKWLADLKLYETKYPEDYKLFKKVLENDYSLSDNSFNLFEYKEEASRKTMGSALEIALKELPTLFAGSADLSSSTFVKGMDGSYSSSNPLGRNIDYGVREHAMGAISNGLNLHNIRNVTGAFFVFSDYMKPAIRMAAIMKLPSIFVFTHDSVAVGEDGPTHEPIEQLASLRSIPNLTVIRPSDAHETVEALKYALAKNEYPTAIVLTRQNLPLLEEVKEEVFLKGAFTRIKEENADITLVSTGSETSLALRTRDVLKQRGIKANVSEIPSTSLFDMQSEEYMNEVVPFDIPSLFIEMASSYGLGSYANYVYALNEFGMSGNASDVINELGFTEEKIADFVEELLNK